MQLIKVKDYQELSDVAGKIMLDVVKANPKCTLGLATGSSPIGLYKYLIKAYENGEVSFKDVKTFNLDEYCELPVTHPESYYSFMHTNLFNHIDIKEENVNIPSSVGDDLKKNCDEYSKKLNAATVDMQLLGIGANGHIGFNEPGTPFDSETLIVTLKDKTRQDNARFFDNDINQVPKHAITMGIKNIMNAKSVLLVASGKNKADAINKLINGPVTEEFPASALQNHKGKVIVVADEEACSLL
ncbi:MAG: glucosamine-6-phosphate deaminase [Bacilli bacterium]|nr:glucosamine-6-phosphate deaminase [Bacilli bacterium]